MSISCALCITLDLLLSKWRISGYSNDRRSEVDV